MSLTPQQIVHAQRTADYDALCAKREQLEHRLIEAAKAAGLLKRAHANLARLGFLEVAEQINTTLDDLADVTAELDREFVAADDDADDAAGRLSCHACGRLNCTDRICQQIPHRTPGPEEDHHA